MILQKKESKNFDDFTSSSFVTTKQMLTILDKKREFRDELIESFDINEAINNVIRIGNSSFLLESLINVDSQFEKIDISTKIKNLHLNKMLDEEKAIFEIFEITDPFILKEIKSDLLLAETRYAAKSDILDIFNFSKFANYCRDQKYEDLIDNVKDYLKVKNATNDEERKLRLIFKKEDRKFYIRALTSTEGYKDYGINFSVFVALMALGKYVDNSGNDVFIDKYILDESQVYVSFTLNREFEINKNLTLSFSLILENDEIKRSSVSFNGFFKLRFEENDKSSEIYLKPPGIKKDNTNYPVELLTYPHKGKIEKVIDKIKDLPDLIEFFIKQVSKDASRISKIENPDDVRKFIIEKVVNSRKPEFKPYKDNIKSKLTSLTVDNIFMLFELLKEVELLFEHDDIISRDFWRSKLYETLINRK